MRLIEIVEILGSLVAAAIWLWPKNKIPYDVKFVYESLRDCSSLSQDFKDIIKNDLKKIEQKLMWKPLNGTVHPDGFYIENHNHLMVAYNVDQDKREVIVTEIRAADIVITET